MCEKKSYVKLHYHSKRVRRVVDEIANERGETMSVLLHVILIRLKNLTINLKNIFKLYKPGRLKKFYRKKSYVINMLKRIDKAIKKLKSVSYAN